MFDSIRTHNKRFVAPPLQKISIFENRKPCELPTYSLYAPETQDARKIAVYVPWFAGYGFFGDVLVNLRNVGRVPLPKALGSWEGKPALIWNDGIRSYHRILEHA